MRRKAIVAVVALVASGLGAAYAFGASETIVSSATCCTYTQPTFTIDAGTVAQFSNAQSNATHNVYASSKGPDQGPLFHSTDLAAGQSGSVDGTQYLASGTYHFVCTIHEGMEADLVVTGNGTPAARPSVTAKILSSDLQKVVSTKKLRVKLSAPTAAQGVVVNAKKGALTLGSSKEITLAAGSSKVASVNVRSGVNAGIIRAKMSKAKLKVLVDVPFGNPAKASRTLR
jgi:plastocyanin